MFTLLCTHVCAVREIGAKLLMLLTLHSVLRDQVNALSIAALLILLNNPTKTGVGAGYPANTRSPVEVRCSSSHAPSF